MRKTVYIEDVSYEGAGVAKMDGKVVFVPKTLQDERVEILITKENAKFAQGQIVDIFQKSDLRKNPPCPYFDKCGGCDFQHCDYEVELDLKRKILSRELRKVGFVGNVEIVPSFKRFEYRNKIKLEVKNGRLGYFKGKSYEFFEIESCMIASRVINKTVELVKRHLSKNKYKMLKNVYIKQVGDNVAICFLFDKNAQKMHKNFKKIDIFDDFSVFFAYGDVLETDKTQIFCVQGKSKLIKNFKGFIIQNDISAFNQVNDDVAEKLYDYVLDLVGNKRVVNAYSGQGLLTALISKAAKFVYGIEYQVRAHCAAQELTGMLENVFNVCGRVENELPGILKKDKIEVIVLDPARDGCKKNVLEEIVLSKIQKIVYISCNFATLTRDLFILRDFYEIENVKIFDMFPCTANMETVVVLSKK